MNRNDFEKLELNKILAACAEYATLDKTKETLKAFKPTGDLNEVRERLAKTAECDELLYRIGVPKIGYFPEVSSCTLRASKGSALSCAELLDVNALLRSARAAYASISSADAAAERMKRLARQIAYDQRLEDDIASKILSTDTVSDLASDALFTIRNKIKSLNERIRETLSEYAAGKDGEYLQGGFVTIRGDRYVVPVKAEYKNRIKGFVHDRSATGATFFIEPEQLLNLNNELIALRLDEKEEVERILKSLSARVGALHESLVVTADILSEIDGYFARAEYAYSIKAVRPKINKRGYVKIIKGRHPLIDGAQVVPVSVALGDGYSLLLLSGANTGGKTVTLKMVGLFTLMAECGLFIPAADGSEICAFSKVFCDVGDSQSIEDSLSTFSSHITNVVSILKEADGDSLVLVDELGGGTNPDEGQALARSVTEELLSKGSRGIITTHFTALKEFAYATDGIENAAMQFDNATFKPLYTIKIGYAGASNALAISRRLGMSESVLDRAELYLSDEGRNYEHLIKRAEESMISAKAAEERAIALEADRRKKLTELEKNLASLEKEKRILGANARAETRRIIGERTARAEELLQELEALFKREELTEADLIRARTLKNKIADEAYDTEESPARPNAYIEATAENIREGATVFVESLGTEGKVLSFNAAKGELEVMCGSLKLRTPLKGVKACENVPETKKRKIKRDRADKVKVVRKFTPTAPALEINVIGMTVEEALYEIENFLDKAICDNLEQVKIIHGVGTGKLRNAVFQRLKRHGGVKEFRSGGYGEGEIGVTIVQLK